jgi:hypothetical protein
MTAHMLKVKLPNYFNVIPSESDSSPAESFTSDGICSTSSSVDEPGE